MPVRLFGLLRELEVRVVLDDGVEAVLTEEVMEVEEEEGR